MHPTTQTVCAHCHTLCPLSEHSCSRCGHDAHVARLACRCPRCRGLAPATDPVDVTAAPDPVDVTAAPDPVLAGALAAADAPEVACVVHRAPHTPGPWYCDPADTNHDFPARQRVFGGGCLLAEVAGNGKGRSGANAQLIAAAPTLLAACQSARALLARLGGANHDPEYSELVAAIALAEAP